MPARLAIPAAYTLVLATVLLFTAVDGYRVTGPNLLPNLDFSEGLAHWRGTEALVTLGGTDPATVELTNDDPRRSAFLVQTLETLEGLDHLKLSLDVKVEDVRPGPRASNRARVVLASHDARGEGLWYLPHILLALSGTKDWTHYEKVFPVGGDAAEIRLVLQLSGATGRMWVRNLMLEPVAERPSHTALSALLLFLWAAFLLWLAIRLGLRIGRRRAYGFVLLAGALILLGTLAPKKYVSEAEIFIASLVAQTTQREEAPAPALAERDATAPLPAGPPEVTLVAAPPPGLGWLTPGKLAHLGVFALLGFALVRARDDESLLFLLGCVGLSAVSSEVLQLFTQGRQALVLDAGLNAAGAGFGLGMAYLWESLRRRLKSRLLRTSD